jgi:hypothetical protein
VAARIRRELGVEVALVHGHYGEFRVLVDDKLVVDGGAVAFLGIMPSAREIINLVQEALQVQPPQPSTG